MDKYQLRGSALADVEAAVDREIEACMRRLGFTYRIDDEPASEWGVEENRRYGIQDSARAAVYGYHPISVIHPPEEPSEVLSDRETAALGGTDRKGRALPKGTETDEGRVIPRGGCHREADRRVRAPYDDAKGVSIARSIDFEGFEESVEDSRVKKAFADWSACMKVKGYTYESPLSVMGSAEFTQKQVTSHERAVAQRDVYCKKKIDLVRRWNSVEAEIQRDKISRNKSDLDRFYALQTAKVSAARKVLNETG
ncbi:hypothetical protein [Streptomyces tendae]|uniref:hypothetical protein n=1 Tax=Streptomyces tendae TaxID=1932 RepID=UPI0037218949